MYVAVLMCSVGSEKLLVVLTAIFGAEEDLIKVCAAGCDIKADALRANILDI